MSQFTTLDFLGRPARQPAQEKNVLFFFLSKSHFLEDLVLAQVCAKVYGIIFWVLHKNFT